MVETTIQWLGKEMNMATSIVWQVVEMSLAPRHQGRGIVLMPLCF